MTTLDVIALRESFQFVTEREPDITRRFYEILFGRHPEVRPLFGPSMRRQEEMLTRALIAVIEHLEKPTWLGDSLRALGAKHVGYGVTAEMYPWVGEALLATLAQVAGDDWSPRIEQAWREAYVAISSLMLEGAESVALQSPVAMSAGPGSRPAA